MILEMTIGNTIKDKRISLNIKQDDLAEQVGVTVQTVSKWERDITEPKASQVHQLSKILKLSEKEICQGSTLGTEVDSMGFARKVGTLMQNIPNIELLLGMHDFIEDRDGFIEYLDSISDYPVELFDVAEKQNCEYNLELAENNEITFKDEATKTKYIEHWKAKLEKVNRKLN